MTERATASGEANPEIVFGRQWEQEAQNYIDASTQTKNSKGAYSNDLSQLRKFLAKHEVNNWPKITPKLIHDFFKDQKEWCSPSTINRRLTVINGFIIWLQQETDYPIVDKVDTAIRQTRKDTNLSRRNFEFKPLSQEEVSKLLGVTANIRDKALIHLLRSGLSAQTLHELTMRNVKASADIMDLRMQIVIPEKKSGGNSKTILLDETASIALNEYMLNNRGADLKKPNSPLFIRQNNFGGIIGNEALTRQGIWLVVKKYATKAQIHCTPQRLNKSLKTLHGSLN